MSTTPNTTNTPSFKSRPLFSVLHTSARPDQWQNVYWDWLHKAKNPQSVEYVLVIDPRWGFDPTELVGKLRPQDKVVVNTGRQCYVEGVNLAARHATGLIFVVNADDQFPCEKWDEELVGCVPPVKEWVIQVSTGTVREWERKMMVMPVLSRTRYDRLGYVFYPEYESMYADNDFYAHAGVDVAAGKIKTVAAPHLLFPHRHPFNDGVPPEKWDAAYQAQNRPEAYSKGRDILSRRMGEKFGVPEPEPRNLELATGVTPPVRGRKPHIAFCLPGEQFSSAWVVEWTDLMVCLWHQYNFTPFFAQSSNVYVTRNTLAKGVLESGQDFDYVVWIDDDNLVSPEQIVELIRALDSVPDAGVVAGWCWIQPDYYSDEKFPSFGGQWEDGTCCPAARVDIEKVFAPGTLLEVGYTGFPVVVMRPNVLRDAGPDYFAPLTGPQFNHGFSGEDVAFCHRVRKAGWKVLIHPQVRVPHLKFRPVGEVAGAGVGNVVVRVEEDGGKRGEDNKPLAVDAVPLLL